MLAPIVQAIRYGVRAPNPHNAQAWKFQLTSDTEALLYLDRQRLLHATDPVARQSHIGAGCCIETLAVGMSAHGYASEVELLPEGAHAFEEVGRKPVARIALRPSSAAADALADAIDRRQTNRKPHQGPPISAHEADLILSALPPEGPSLRVLQRPEQMAPLLQIFDRAFQIEVHTRRTHEEARAWFRIGERRRQQLRDGLSVPQLGYDGVRARLTEWSLLGGHPRIWFSAISVRSAIANMRRGSASARGLLLLETKTNDQAAWLAAGRAFARVHLALTQHGLTCHPYTQVLQEYPELAALQAEFNQLLGIEAPAKIQMAARIGRAERSYPAPRRAVDDFIVNRQT